jgi:hypothetical protein
LSSAAAVLSLSGRAAAHNTILFTLIHLKNIIYYL